MRHRPPRPASRRLRGITAAALLIATASGCWLTTDVPASRASAGSAPAHLRHLPSSRATVIAVGDGADGAAGTRALARSIVRADPRLFLYLGDVYETGTPEEFRIGYDPLYGALASRTAPTVGNHEFANRRRGYLPYWRSRTGGTLPPYYSFRVAGWTLISLNSEARHDAGSPQVRWLRRQLRNPGTCRIAFWHRPRYSAGIHGDQQDVAPLWDALRGHARLVLSGHDHDSQRIARIDGMTQIVAGGGGHSIYPLRPLYSRLAFGDARKPAALWMVLRPGVAELSFRRANGRVIDRARAHCRKLSAA